jgi:hypothetical protein
MNFPRLLRDIVKWILGAVFLEWMERLRGCSATNGEYFEEAETSVVGEIISIREMARCYACVGYPGI